MCILVALVLLMNNSAKAGTGNPDTVRIGIYITSIHNIDFREREYSIAFWLWLKYKKKKFYFSKYLEIPNAKTHTYEFIDSNSTKDEISLLMKATCVMKDSWRVHNFPLDKQRLWLTIENSQFNSDSLVFIADTTGSCFDRRIRYAMTGWKIDSCVMESGLSLYETAFGDVSILKPVSTYSAFKVKISISREAPVLLFVKIFLGMYIAFLIAYICFYIQPGNFDSRFQLSVGALFAAIGNKYIVEASLPESTSFTLVDSLHGVTLFFILLTIALTEISLRMGRRNKKPGRFRFDMVAAQALLIAYITINLVFIFKANSVHSFEKGSDSHKATTRIVQIYKTPKNAITGN